MGASLPSCSFLFCPLSSPCCWGAHACRRQCLCNLSGWPPPHRAISSPAVRPARIDSTSQGEDPSTSKRLRALPGVRYAPSSHGQGPKDPISVLPAAWRTVRPLRPPFDKQPGQGTREPQEAYGPNFGSGVTTPHLAPWAIVAPVLFWAASAMVLRCRWRSLRVGRPL